MSSAEFAERLENVDFVYLKMACFSCLSFRKTDTLAFIVDDRDSLKRWLHEIQDILNYTDTKANIDACNIYDTERRGKLKSTKIVFFLDEETSSLT